MLENVIKTVFQRYSGLMKFKMKYVYTNIYSEKSNITTYIVPGLGIKLRDVYGY